MPDVDASGKPRRVTNLSRSGMAFGGSNSPTPITAATTVPIWRFYAERGSFGIKT